VEHVEGVPWRGYGNAEAYVEWNGMDMDPHYGSICGFRGMDLNPAVVMTEHRGRELSGDFDGGAHRDYVADDFLPDHSGHERVNEYK